MRLLHASKTASQQRLYLDQCTRHFMTRNVKNASTVSVCVCGLWKNK